MICHVIRYDTIPIATPALSPLASACSIKGKKGGWVAVGWGVGVFLGSDLGLDREQYTRGSRARETGSGIASNPVSLRGQGSG